MSDTQKVSEFALAIKQETEKQRDRIQKETDSYIALELEKAENGALLESYEYIKRSAENIRTDLGSKLSAKHLEQNHLVVSRRDELCDEIFNKTKIRIQAFCKSEDYKTFLTNSAKRICEYFSTSILTVYICERDEAIANFISPLFDNCRLTVDKTIRLGGFKAETADGKLLADDTLDTRLQIERENFAKSSGFVIN